MAYKGQPIPSTVININEVKISDGKSVRVTVPEKTTIVAGNFYVLDGFFGAALQSVTTAAGESAEIIINIDQVEFITDQIDTTKSLAKGEVAYYDATAGKLTDEAGTNNRAVGRITSAKDAANTIQFILGPQI